MGWIGNVYCPFATVVGLTITNDLEEEGGVPCITMSAVKIFKKAVIFVIVFLSSEDFP